MRAVDLREIEKSKIFCARRHFASLSNSIIKYDTVKSYDDLCTLVIIPNYAILAVHCV